MSDSKRGFRNMSPERVREIARLGALAAHRRGVAYRFNKKEAAKAGVKGGQATHKKGTAHKFTSETARAAGLKARWAREARRLAAKADEP